MTDKTLEELHEWVFEKQIKDQKIRNITNITFRANGLAVCDLLAYNMYIV